MRYGGPQGSASAAEASIGARSSLRLRSPPSEVLERVRGQHMRASRARKSQVAAAAAEAATTRTAITMPATAPAPSEAPTRGAAGLTEAGEADAEEDTLADRDTG